MQILRDSAVFDKWWGRVVLALCMAFIGWFIVAEFDGLRTLGEWLWNGIRLTPDGLAYIVNYYGNLAIEQLLFSVLVGVVFGTGVTLFLYYANKPLYKNGLSRRVILTGVIGGALGSQVLAYPTQHCSYASDAPSAEALLGIVITAVGTFFVLIPAWSLLFRREGSKNLGNAGYFANRFGLAYWLLLPMVASLAVFLYFPATEIIRQSLRVQVQVINRYNFECLGNYVRLAEDNIYQNSFLTTAIITVSIVFFTMAIGLGIAVLASQKVRGASIYRTLLVWPYALSPVVTGVIFISMFRQGRSGLINAISHELFGTTQDWFTNPQLAVGVIVLASVWNALGFNILFYIAGLQNVPKDLLEAAQIDGANVVQRFARITFPLLSPYTFFLLVANVTYSFYGIYGAIDVLTGGGPPVGPGGRDGGATSVLIYKLYQDSFIRTGEASAQALILFVLVAGITLIQFRFVERRVTYAD